MGIGVLTGGDETLRIANRFYEMGCPIIGIPKIKQQNLPLPQQSKGETISLSHLFSSFSSFQIG